jgi:hypothetical protein
MTDQRQARKDRMAAAAAVRTEPQSAPAGRTAIRTAPARVTLNLPPELYRQLQRWTDSAAEAIDVPRVGVQDALRAMIRVITDDSSPNSAAKVLVLLREDRV